MSLTSSRLKRCLFGWKTSQTMWWDVLLNHYWSASEDWDTDNDFVFVFRNFCFLKGVKQSKWAQTLWGLQKTHIIVIIHQKMSLFRSLLRNEGKEKNSYLYYKLANAFYYRYIIQIEWIDNKIVDLNPIHTQSSREWVSLI